MRNQKGLRYSYTNHDSMESKFINKNFNKTSSYHTNFSGAKFTNTSLIGAKFKFCSFYGAEFYNCYIRGSLFRGCNLQELIFKDCIICSSIFDQCKLKGCRFERCKIMPSTSVERIFPEKCFFDVEFFDKYPAETEFDPSLINIVEELRNCDLIRRSTVLHRRRGKLDTVSLKMLVDIFRNDFLINHLGDLPNIITNEFHSLSYITRALQKFRGCDKKESPGSAALGAPKLNE